MQTPAWPQSFLTRMSSQLGDSYPVFLEALSTTPPVSVRVNSNKIHTPVSHNARVPWCTQGYYLAQRPLFTADPLLHAGAYYVQEAGSMFIEQALVQHANMQTPLRILDLCAAPGGKSTHLLDLINADSLLVSNEVIRSRAQVLKENLAKWGKPNVVVTNNDPKDFSKLEGYFDVIIMDAPCSGEGLFRRDPNAAKEWSEDTVKLCSLRQQRILHDIWPCLKPGGLLIYSTCTYAPQENEDNILFWAQTTNARSLKTHTEPAWGITETNSKDIYGYRFYPHMTRSEGFFCSILKKDGNTENTTELRFKKTKFNSPNKTIQAELSQWLSPDTEWIFNMFSERVSAFPKALADDLSWLANSLNIVSSGTDIAELIREKPLPLHDLALSVYRQPDAFSVITLNQHDAIAYLRKDDLRLPDNTPQGIVLTSYNGMGLGFGKWLGNRFNNYYPKDWRILKQITEDQYFSLL